MNILLYVMTILMVLTLMTYARLESYRSSQLFQVVFEHYMRVDERALFNLDAKGQYDTISAPPKSEKTPQTKEPQQVKSPSSPRISISLLTNQPEREKKAK